MLILAKCENPYVNNKGIIYACGQCPQCQRNKILEWKLRAVHETLFNEKVCFVTCTYKPKNLPKSGKTKPMNKHDKCGTLEPKHHREFTKRLRTYCDRKLSGRKIRYIMCGEYGTDKWRPHYHYIIWGINHHEALILQPELQKLWGYGFVHVDDKTISEHAIQYVLGYTRKKIPNNSGGRAIYEMNGRIAPFKRQSQGIGRNWCDHWKETWTETMTIGTNGYQSPIPRYYIKRIQKQEGQTIKYKIWTTTQEGEKKERYEYKVIPNPQGQYTQRVWYKQAEILKNNFKAWEEKLDKDVDIFDLKKCEENYKDVFIKRIEKNIEEWNYIQTHNKLDIWWKYSHHVIHKKPKKINRIEENIKNLNIDKKTYMKLKHRAWSHNEVIRGGVFGKRNRYELLEELYQTY